MRLTEIENDGRMPVDGFGPGFTRLGGKVWRGPLTVLPEGIAPWGGYEDLAALTAAAGGIDLLILGTGAEIRPPPAGFRAGMEAAGIAVEFMATPSACRTFNLLLTEGRHVGLALVPV